MTPYASGKQWEIHHADNLAILRAMPDASVDSVVTDPPSGIAFMGKEWDTDKGGRDAWIAWLAEIMREAMRVTKPGGHALVWALPRTSHWTATAVEDAGWEIRDSIHHAFGCLDEASEILTDIGWIPYHKLKSARLALCYNLEHDTYSWAPIEDRLVYDYDALAFRVRGDGVDQLLSYGHRCVVERDGAWRFERVEAVARQQAPRVPVLEGLRDVLDGLSVRDAGGGSAQSVLRGLRPDASAGPTSGNSGADGGVGDAGMCGLREASGAARGDAEGCRPDVLRALLPSVNARGGAGHEGGRRAGSVGMDGGESRVVRAEDARGAEPSMEGRRDVLPEARELRPYQVRPVPAGVERDGAAGRVRDGAPLGGRTGDGAGAAALRGGASRQPRPDGQPGGEPDAVPEQSGAQTVRGEGHTRAVVVGIEQEHYRGVMWCVRVATGAFVARRNGGTPFVTGNSGFPKSADVSKAIDKAAGAAREVVGWSDPSDPRQSGKRATRDAAVYSEGINRGAEPLPITVAATDDARAWSGWGTSLKPAHEIWILARKPFKSTVAANVLKHGTGAINVDGCRVATGEDTRRNAAGGDNGLNGEGTFKIRERRADEKDQADGRWPTNMLLSHSSSCECVGTRKFKPTNGSGVAVRRNIEPDSMTSWLGSRASATGEDMTHLDPDGTETIPAWDCAPGCPVAEMDRQSGELTSGDRTGHRTRPKTSGVYGAFEIRDEAPSKGDTGGASRFLPTFAYEAADFAPFLYSAKPATSEKEAGLGKGAGKRANVHPTVKSIALMRWLCRLVTPPGGLVLDPFAGSGTTGVAALREGFRFVGIEREAEYVAIARRRIEEDSPLFNRSGAQPLGAA